MVYRQYDIYITNITSLHRNSGVVGEMYLFELYSSFESGYRKFEKHFYYKLEDLNLPLIEERVCETFRIHAAEILNIHVWKNLKKLTEHLLNEKEEIIGRHERLKQEYNEYRDRYSVLYNKLKACEKKNKKNEENTK